MTVNPRIAIPSLVVLSLMLAALAPQSAGAQDLDKPEEAAPTSVIVPAETSPDAGETETLVEPAPRFRLGAQANLMIPIGDYADVADVAVGGDLRFAWDLHANVGMTFRAGYLHHFGVANDATLGFVPLMIGGEYRFFGEGSTPFVAAELGMTIGILAGSVSTPWGSASGSDTDIAFALGIGGGYRFGPVDVKAMLIAPDVDDAVGFQISVGGDFARF